MRSTFLALAATLILGLALPAGPGDDDETVYIDLQPKANQKLKEPFHSGNFKNNHLESLPTGVQKFEGVKFKIGEGLLQLGSTQLPKLPEKFEGIPVGRKVSVLHVLHATGYGSSPEGNPLHVPDDTVIGKYVIHYEDKTDKDIDIVYGRDVRDWWYAEGDQGVDRSKVAWTGENEGSKSVGKKLRLFLTTWENPKPAKKVVSIDYVATQPTMTAAAPFCVAITAITTR